MGKCAHIGCINGKHVELILQIRFVLLFNFFQHADVNGRHQILFLNSLSYLLHVNVQNAR